MDENKIKLENLNMQLFMKYEKEIKESLSNDITRYWHSISVAITAVNLGSVYGENLDNCMVAGLLHDYSKCVPLDELISECEKEGVILSEEDKKADGCIHGFLAAKVCKDKFNINDEVYNAIYFHTCGRPNMTMLEKIIYVSDYIEPIRKFRDKINDIREISYTDIDKAVIMASEKSLEYLNTNNRFIHSNTFKTLEYYKNL